MDVTPPPSPTEEELESEKRRSVRHLGEKRKKYTEEIENNFSEEDFKKLPKDDATAMAIKLAAMEDVLGPMDKAAADTVPSSTENSNLPDNDVYQAAQAGPNYPFVDPTAEDTMIILACRMSVRELEDSEDEPAKPAIEKIETNGSEEVKLEEEKDDIKPEENSSPDKSPLKMEVEASPTKDPYDFDDDSQGSEPVHKVSEKLTPVKSNDEKDGSETTNELKSEITPTKNSEEETPSDIVPKPKTTPLKELKIEGNKPPRKPGDPAPTIEIEEYLVKFKNFSYFHCHCLPRE